MYLRHATRRQAGPTHTYWRLVRAVRLGKRVVQQTVAQLGEILLAEKMISAEQLKAALELQRSTGKVLGRILVDQGALTEVQLVSALATQIGMPFVDLSDMVIDGSAIGRLPGAVCRRHHVLPIGIENGTLPHGSPPIEKPMAL